MQINDIETMMHNEALEQKLSPEEKALYDKDMKEALEQAIRLHGKPSRGYDE